MSARRYFNNENVGQECLEDVVVGKGCEAAIKDEVRARIKSALLDMVRDIERASHSFDKHDVSVYTGLSGYALLYLHLHKVLGDPKYLAQATKYVTSALKRLKGRRISFLCGDAGPLAIGAVVYILNGENEKSSDCVQQLLSMARSVIAEDVETYDELLYGRAGYLYSLLYVKKNISGSIIPDEVINGTVNSIVESGKRSACRRPSGPALIYTWHDSEYIGAAHGYIGILFLMLMTGHREPYLDLIKSTTDFILGMQYPSGNFPSSVGSGNDRLVHWCHGAPGGVYLMMKAYEVFKEEKYLESAKKASEVVWDRGLLKKGYGICHGAAGNGYGFLEMYKLTKDPKYLYKAVQFGLWCCDYKHRQGLRTPDRPYSMFEGIAGTAYFLGDLLQHEHSAFPAFQF